MSQYAEWIGGDSSRARHGRDRTIHLRPTGACFALLCRARGPGETCADSRFQTAADMSVCVLATQNRVRGVARIALSIEEGAGKAGRPPHPRPPCIMKSTGKEPQVWSGQSRPSLRNGLTAYTALPGEPDFLAPIAARNQVSRRLGTSVGVPGPHGFAVRGRLRQRHATGPVPVRRSFGESGPASLVQRHRRVHRIPRSTSVTTAKRPSDERGTAGANHIFLKTGRRIFFAAGPDRRIGVEAAREFRFFAQGIFPMKRIARATMSPKSA